MSRLTSPPRETPESNTLDSSGQVPLGAAARPL
jgi:hypothetical protein